MAKSRQTFNKKELEKKRQKKKEEKGRRKVERKNNSSGGGLDSMIAYVDSYGNIVDTPPEIEDPKKKKEEVIEISVPKRIDEPVEDLTGKVVFINDEKGYGFIRDSKTQEKYFAHSSNYIDDIREEDTVTFELERGPKGYSAIKVKKIVK